MLPPPTPEGNSLTEKWLKLNAEFHTNPSRVKSILEDLPVKKARNSYTKIVDGRIVPKAGEDGEHKPSHRFFFRFFPISTTHMNTVNFIMLQECHRASMIAFKSKDRIAKTLEEYFHYSVTSIYSAYLSADLDHPADDPQMICLDKLQQAAKELGTNVNPVVIGDLKNLQMKQVRQAIEDSLSSTPSEDLPDAMAIYGILARIPCLYDMDQAKKMLKLRIKIDVWSHGTEEDIRQENRDNLHKIYRDLPPYRFWLYLKYVRNMESGSAGNNGFYKMRSVSKEDSSGPEDTVGKHHRLFKSEAVTRLMYFAWHSGNYFTKIGSDDRVSRVQNLAFGPSGTICNCDTRIPAIEEKAKICVSALYEAGLPREFRNPYWDELENIEMAARVWLRPKLQETLGEQLKDIDVESLDWLLFEIVHPTATKMGGQVDESEDPKVE